MARRIITAREQVEMLSPWRIVASLSPQEMAARERHLTHRRYLYRNPGASPAHDRYLSENPPLTPEEEQEHKGLQGWASDLSRRWDSMAPMTPDEVEAHRITDPLFHKEPDKMTEKERAEHYGELHNRNKRRSFLSPREKHDYQSMSDWAQGRFGNMQNDARDEMERWKEYDAYGTHPGGSETMKGVEGAHRPELTGAWAAELDSSTNAHPHLRAAASEYRQAMTRVATKGPFAPIDEEEQIHGPHAHEALTEARNNLRVELQHHQLFGVPDVDQLSKLNHPDEAKSPKAVNPRYFAGTPTGDTYMHRQAYTVNCQRCTLAYEARQRGYNVEAQRNYRGFNEEGDKSFDDHGIASWFRNSDGSVPTWTDTEDHDIEKYRDATGYSPGDWGRMTADIASWGPGARGAVTYSHSLPGSAVSRHIINTHVDQDGKVHYTDAQDGNEAVNPIARIAYDAHPDHKRERAAYSNPAIPSDAYSTQVINNAHSPLRYMRLDDKQFHPQVSRYMVDRGSATDTPIKAP